MQRLSPQAEHISLILHDFASGGSELVAIRLANLWASHGRRVTIVCGNDEGPSLTRVSTQVSVQPVVPRIVRSFGSRRRVGIEAAALVRSLAPDVVVGPGNFHIPILWQIQKTLGSASPPIVAKLSNPLTRQDRSRIGQFIFSRRMRAATRDFVALVALAPTLAEEARYVLARQRIAVLANPSLADDWTPPPPRYQTKTIVCAGRLAPQKRFTLALEAFATLPTDYRLVLLGEGPERKSLERRIRDLGLTDRVSMPGFVASIVPYLQQADALLVSARYEGYPGVILEALSQGVPVATTRCTSALDGIMRDESFGRIAAETPSALGIALQAVATGLRPTAEKVWSLLKDRRQSVAASAWLQLLDEVVADNGREQHQASGY